MSEVSARLLVVDDNEDNRDMLARRLERRGFDVKTADCGETAIALIDSTPFDLVLLDVMMPGMSGLEVLEQVRKTYPRAELPILMATAKTSSEDVVEALRLGANDYVTKPIDFPVVVARIENHLQTRKQAPSIPAAATSIPADGRVAPGQVLDGRYEIVRTLGEGAFAIVYEAKQLSTGQRVAVKILHTHRASDNDDVERQRFEREMQTIGKLNHPHIVRLIDYGTLKATVQPISEGWMETADGAGFDVDQSIGGTRIIVRRLPYIVMEFVEGETLHEHMKREGAMDAQSAVDLLVPIVSAVAEGHRCGVVHRDLKPPNIIIGRSVGIRPHPTVLDFGIAKPKDEETLAQRGESLFGTPEYMAPEVLLGSVSAGTGADQYALGVMLYEIILGERAFRADSYIDLIQQISEKKLPRLDQIADVSPELAQVIQRAIERDPDDRYSSVATFGRGLLHHASHEVESQWTGSFAVPSDPPPGPPKSDSDAPSDSDPQDDTQPALAVPAATDSATRLGFGLMIGGVILVIAAIAAYFF
ncbi:MAG: protein kinase [Polyangiales bacterium]